MADRYHAALAVLLAVVVIFSAQVASAQTTYTITVQTNASSYVSGQRVNVTGAVSPAPGSSTGVTVRVTNSAGHLVAIGDAPVGATTGSYSYAFTAGGTADWTSGTYTVNATWGAYPPTIFKTTTFTYTTATTTTSTTNPTTTSTTTSTTTPSSTSRTTSVTATSSTTTQPSSTSTTPVPEFPYQAALAGLFVLAIALAYALARRSKAGRPSAPSIGRA